MVYACPWLLMTAASSLTVFNEGISRHKNAMSKLFLYETTAIISYTKDVLFVAKGHGLVWRLQLLV